MNPCAWNGNEIGHGHCEMRRMNKANSLSVHSRGNYKSIVNLSTSFATVELPVTMILQEQLKHQNDGMV
jgi:hypothetical protein